MIGRVVGTYKILKTLGEGGVGMVYKGVDTMLDREVAIKVMRPELASQTSVVERFRTEAITLAKLNHPNIATLFSLFREADDLFMVLEFVEGETLDEILQRRGAIPTEEALPIFCQALDGINYAHDLGIVHRDIKPSNMMIDASGKLKVLDFGIARLLGTARMTRVGNIIGTLEYMSPEQVRGEETDARSDIYGLGMMFYEVLTGRLPFESDNEFVLMKAHTEEMPVPPRELNPEIPVELEAAIMKAVAKDPADRFQDGGEFLETIFDMDFPGTEHSPGAWGIKNAQVRHTKRVNKVQSKDFPADLSETAEVPIETPSIALVEETSANANQDAGVLMGQIKETRLGRTEDSPIPPPRIKETRLGKSKAPITDASLVKETRLDVQGTAGVPGLSSPASATSQIQSFLEKLGWVHYAVAGVVAIAFLGIVGLAAIIPFMFGGESPEKPKVVINENSNTKPSVEPTLETIFTEGLVEADQTPEATPIGTNEEDPPSPKPAEVTRKKRTPSPKPNQSKKPTPRRTPSTAKTPNRSKDQLRERLTKPKTKKTPSLTDN